LSPREQWQLTQTFAALGATNAKATSRLCFGFGPASLSLQEEAESEHVLAIGRLIAKFHLLADKIFAVS
jgi:hypothetical protein